MKIALVMADDFSLWQPRRGLIKELVRRGFEVYGISTPGEYVERLVDLGMIHIPVKMERFLDPVKDVCYLWSLYTIFRTYKFDIVHNMTTKPNIYGVIAARMAKIDRVVSSVEGLGQTLSGEEDDLRSKVVRFCVIELYRLACRFCHKVRFMNSDDLAYFVSHKLVDPKKAVLIVGEGVDLSEYSPTLVAPERVQMLRKMIRANEKTRVVTMVARMNWNKGVREFIEASNIVARKILQVKFLLVGTIDGGPSAVPRRYLEENESDHLQWLGFAKDLREIFIISDIVVLPSYVREGVPNTLIEAMAMGKPIVTTDNVGCREVVQDGCNGFLVPIKDSQTLANAIEKILQDRGMLLEFSRQSRLRVEQEFDERLVIEKLLSEVYFGRSKSAANL